MFPVARATRRECVCDEDSRRATPPSTLREKMPSRPCFGFGFGTAPIFGERVEGEGGRERGAWGEERVEGRGGVGRASRGVWGRGCVTPAPRRHLPSNGCAPGLCVHVS